jgi:hypothetical protein
MITLPDVPEQDSSGTPEVRQEQMRGGIDGNIGWVPFALSYGYRRVCKPNIVMQRIRRMSLCSANAA